MGIGVGGREALKHAGKPWERRRASGGARWGGGEQEVSRSEQGRRTAKNIYSAVLYSAVLRGLTNQAQARNACTVRFCTVRYQKGYQDGG